MNMMNDRKAQIERNLKLMKPTKRLWEQQDFIHEVVNGTVIAIENYDTPNPAKSLLFLIPPGAEHIPGSKKTMLSMNTERTKMLIKFSMSVL